jgi:hypothetical protein
VLTEGLIVCLQYDEPTIKLFILSQIEILMEVHSLLIMPFPAEFD